MVYTPPKYPGAIPTIEDLPNRIDDVDWLYAARYNELKKELRAALIELGVFPKGTSENIAERIKGVRSLATAIADTIVIKEGNVGIGTVLPGVKLDIIGGNVKIEHTQPDLIVNWTNTGQFGRVLFKENGTDIGVFQAIGSAFATASRRGNLEFFATPAGNDITFWTNSGQRITIKAGGNVGIGTISPGQKLHVHNSTGLDIAKFTGTGSWPKINLFSGTSGAAFHIKTAAGGNGLEFAFNDVTDDGYLQIFGNNNFYIYTNGQIRLAVLGDGKVGIGTNDPKSNLHVVGLPIYANNAAAITGGLTVGAFYRTGADPDPVCVVH